MGLNSAQSKVKIHARSRFVEFFATNDTFRRLVKMILQESLKHCLLRVPMRGVPSSHHVLLGCNAIPLMIISSHIYTYKKPQRSCNDLSSLVHQTKQRSNQTNYIAHWQTVVRRKMRRSADAVCMTVQSGREKQAIGMHKSC